MPDCSIRLEAAEADRLRRLSGSHSDQTLWTQSSLPPPLNLPPFPLQENSPAAFDQQLVLPTTPVTRSPPPHGPLSPVTLPISTLPTSDQNDCLVTPGSSPQIGSWDNFLESPSYELGERAFWSASRDIRKIPIVSTDISDLDFSSESSDSLIGPSDQKTSLGVEEVKMAPTQGCTDAASALVTAKNCLQVAVDMLDPDEIDASYIHTVPAELESIKILNSQFMVQVLDILDKFKAELDPTVVTSWQEEKMKAKKLVLDHKKLVWNKCNEISPIKPLSHFENQSLKNQSKQLALQETAVDNTVGAEESRCLGIAEVKYDALVASSKKILTITRDRSEEDLVAEDDEKIRKYMRELPDIRTSVEKFQDDIIKFKEHTAMYKLTTDKHQNIEYFQENVQSKVDSYVENLEKEDCDRALFTMESAPGEKVKWPKFSGEIEENYAKFKEKFENAAS